MHLVKPAWVMHTDEKKKRLPIFSIHVHGDGSRLATGGMDSKVRIWSTAPILDANNTMPKTLCTLTMHVGPVLCVRWSQSGRLLASGSDDGLVMIWDLDPTGAGKVFGEEEVNVEGWKALRRLAGHESDVSDLAWSPQDRYLASVSMDSSVIIWDGYSFDRVAKLVGHQGLVKGVCWDPVGQYLATQSDDKSVRIWRTTDWGVERIVTQPFELSPTATFFRRLSWSPDGAHITAANAMNGPVFVAAVISRKEWTSDISLVGHENTVEVAAYNPHLFVRDESKPVDSHNICSVLALGADDRSVSIWQTNQARPLLVAQELFDRNVLDLSWSFDGLTLYACSSDGTIAVMSFNPSELRGIAPHDIQISYLKGYKFNSPMNVGHQPPPQPLPPPPSFPPVVRQQLVLPTQNLARQQDVTRTKDGKRRIRPVLISQGSSTAIQQPQHQSQTNGILPTIAPTPTPLYAGGEISQSREIPCHYCEQHKFRCIFDPEISNQCFRCFARSRSAEQCGIESSSSSKKRKVDEDSPGRPGSAPRSDQASEILNQLERQVQFLIEKVRTDSEKSAIRCEMVEPGIMKSFEQLHAALN